MGGRQGTKKAFIESVDAYVSAIDPAHRKRQAEEAAGGTGSRAAVPPVVRQAEILKAQREAARNPALDPVDRVARGLGQKPVAEGRAENDPKSPGEAVKKLYTRKDGRGANRIPARKRKPRDRKRDR